MRVWLCHPIVIRGADAPVVSMSQFAWAALAALLLYFALRVATMKRSMPFVFAFPLFVLILLGGGIAVFVAASWVVVLFPLGREEALIALLAVTAVGLFPLWWLARRAITRRE
jgi:multisubunit Na+/H+ antiporter MnhB subunit